MSDVFDLISPMDSVMTNFAVTSNAHSLKVTKANLNGQ